jgi:NCS1 family nucleobase:cation symporter-1
MPTAADSTPAPSSPSSSPGVIALLFTFLPTFESVRDFSWFLAAGLGAVIYGLIADKRGPFHDVHGDEIAVTPTH